MPCTDIAQRCCWTLEPSIGNHYHTIPSLSAWLCVLLTGTQRGAWTRIGPLGPSIVSLNTNKFIIKRRIPRNRNLFLPSSSPPPPLLLLLLDLTPMGRGRRVCPNNLAAPRRRRYPKLISSPPGTTGGVRSSLSIICRRCLVGKGLHTRYQGKKYRTPPESPRMCVGGVQKQPLLGAAAPRRRRTRSGNKITLFFVTGTRFEFNAGVPTRNLS